MISRHILKLQKDAKAMKVLLKVENVMEDV